MTGSARQQAQRTIHFLLPANYVGSTTRVIVEFANRLVARGFRVIISVPYFNHLDFVLWHLHREGKAAPGALVMARQWAAWLLAPLLTSLVVRTRWIGQAIHQVDERIRVNRFWCVPTAWNMPDADYLVTLQGYLIPRLLYLPAGKGELIGSIRIDNLAGMQEPDALRAEWRRYCTAFEQRLNVRMFALSHDVRDAARALGIEIETVIYNGVNTQEFVDGKRRGDVTPVRITMFYSHHPQKGKAFGCEVIRRVRQARLDRDVIIRSVGATVSPADQALFDLNDGYLTGADYVKMYQDTDIFVFPSLYEGMGAPPLESMASGCALVTSRIQGLDRYGVHERNCLIASPGDVETMADHVRRLIEDVSLRDALREQALRTAQQWSWEAATERLVAFLQDRQPEGTKEPEGRSEQILVGAKTLQQVTSDR